MTIGLITPSRTHAISIYQMNAETPQQLQEFCDAACEAANRGGEVLLKWLGKTSPQKKGFRDFVTQADFESQQVIQDFLQQEFPDHRFIGEEDLPSESQTVTKDDYCWIVDPLDGTTNYVHQLRSFSVSIGLRRGDQTIVGSVLDPVLKETYAAMVGQGATLNGEPIKTSGADELGEALFVFSFGRGCKRDDPQVIRFLNILEEVSSVRRLGSAALNLCYVACGRTDAYWATQLKKWDVAAGWLIAQEAGATIKDFTDKPLDIDKPFFCAAASEALFEQAKPLLNV